MDTEKDSFNIQSWLSKLGRELGSELVEWLKLIFPFRGLWIFVPGIAGMVLVYTAYYNGWQAILVKGNNEALAIVIMSLVVAVLFVRAAFFRCHLDFILFALSVAFLCREIHFVGTHKGVYVAATIIGIWGFFWRDKLFDEVREKPFLKISLAFMVVTYALAMLIQRRALRHVIPIEQELHIELEEVVENISHLSFLWVACWCFSLKRKLQPEQNDAGDDNC